MGRGPQPPTPSAGADSPPPRHIPASSGGWWSRLRGWGCALVPWKSSQDCCSLLPHPGRGGRTAQGCVCRGGKKGSRVQDGRWAASHPRRPAGLQAEDQAPHLPLEPQGPPPLPWELVWGRAPPPSALSSGSSCSMRGFLHSVGAGALAVTPRGACCPGPLPRSSFPSSWKCAPHPQPSEAQNVSISIDVTSSDQGSNWFPSGG